MSECGLMWFSGTDASPTWSLVNAQGIGNYTNQADGDGIHNVTWTSVLDPVPCSGGTSSIGCDKVRLKLEVWGYDL